MQGKKYCKFCGTFIDEACVICTACGKQVEELKYSNAGNTVRIKKQHSLLFDIVLLLFCFPIYLIYVLFRPSYIEIPIEEKEEYLARQEESAEKLKNTYKILGIGFLVVMFFVVLAYAIL